MSLRKVNPMPPRDDVHLPIAIMALIMLAGLSVVAIRMIWLGVDIAFGP